MRSIFGVLILLALGGTVRAAEQKVLGPDGKTIGVLLDCNTCKEEGVDESCVGGAEEGFHDGKPCGKCLMEANFGEKLMYANDLKISGILQGVGGAPLPNEFIRLYLPNTWTVRTRTAAKGYFRLLLGATLDRQGSQIEVDLGIRTRLKGGTGEDYSLFMLPENYKPCKPAAKDSKD